MTNATQYIRQIRNKAKKAYAASYQQWLADGEAGPAPERGELSYLAAQAVRMNLHNCQHLDK